MEIDKKEIRPITNVLGLAILDSQRLEYSIAFMMLLVNEEINLNNQEHNDKIDNYMINLSKKTLGGLIRQLKKIMNLDNTFSNRLEEALEARNYLTHRFFNDQAEKLLTQKGREDALELVKKKREILFQCYFFLDPYIQILMKIRGFSSNMFTDEVKEKFQKDS